MSSRAQIYLASASPRRRTLLEQIGISYETLNVSIDETPLPQERPDAYVRRLALAKAQAGLASFSESASSPVMGADTAVCINGRLLGKPCDQAEGLAMLATLSGREHQVLSAVALVTTQRAAARVQTSQVRWRELSTAECMAYWETGEAHDKAGSYGIQGRAAAFITELHGSYSGVMGLPLFETAELLKEFGIHVL